jgi:hypothetical protein
MLGHMDDLGLICLCYLMSLFAFSHRNIEGDIMSYYIQLVIFIVNISVLVFLKGLSFISLLSELVSSKFV